MTLQKLIKNSLDFKRIVLIGTDSRIKQIYETKEAIPIHFLDMKVYGHILRKDGDLDVKVNL